MNHGELGVYGAQTKEGLGIAKSHKTKGSLTQTMIAHQAFKCLYLLPSVLSGSFVVNSLFSF